MGVPLLAVAGLMRSGAPFIYRPVPTPIWMSGSNSAGWRASINVASYVTAPGRTARTYRLSYASAGPYLGNPTLSGSTVTATSGIGAADLSGLSSYAVVEVTANGLSVLVSLAFRIPS